VSVAPGSRMRTTATVAALVAIFLLFEPLEYNGSYKEREQTLENGEVVSVNGMSIAGRLGPWQIPLFAEIPERDVKPLS
jgi:hypothetical protein